MPITPQNQQLSQLQQQMQQQQMQQMLGPLIQKLMQSQQLGTPPNAQMSPGMTTPPASPAGSGSPLLRQLMGGMNPMGGPQGAPQPNTLGVNQPIPMQMPNPDPTGQQQQPPLPPDPTDMQGNM